VAAVATCAPTVSSGTSPLRPLTRFVHADLANGTERFVEKVEMPQSGAQFFVEHPQILQMRRKAPAISVLRL